MLGFRRAPPGTLPSSILKDLISQINLHFVTNFIKAIVQDDLDKRRFYIRYSSLEAKRDLARKGFKIGDIKIPPEKADISAYIPNVPHYLDLDDMKEILSRYGTIVSCSFQTFEKTDIRCGGFNFDLDVADNASLPSKLHILNDIMVIKRNDDIKQCSYCDNYGHLKRHCRKRTRDLEHRAHQELLDQLNDLQEDPNEETDDVEMSDEEGTQNGEDTGAEEFGGTPSPQSQPEATITTSIQQQQQQEQQQQEQHPPQNQQLERVSLDLLRDDLRLSPDNRSQTSGQGTTDDETGAFPATTGQVIPAGTSKPANNVTTNVPNFLSGGTLRSVPQHEKKVKKKRPPWRRGPPTKNPLFYSKDYEKMATYEEVHRRFTEVHSQYRSEVRERTDITGEQREEMLEDASKRACGVAREEYGDIFPMYCEERSLQMAESKQSS